MEKSTKEITSEVLSEMLPNTSQDGHNRVMSNVLGKDTKKAEKKASKQMKSNSSGGIFTSVEQRKRAANLLNGMMPNLAELSKEIRRPFVAQLTTQTTLENTRKITGIPFSKWEWSQARCHTRSPGPFMPVKKVAVERQRCLKESVSAFLDLLGGSFLQAHAVGMSRHKFRNGEEKIFYRL